MVCAACVREASLVVKLMGEPRSGDRADVEKRDEIE
jgi:hypothetical protein